MKGAEFNKANLVVNGKRQSETVPQKVCDCYNPQPCLLGDFVQNPVLWARFVKLYESANGHKPFVE